MPDGSGIIKIRRDLIETASFKMPKTLRQARNALSAQLIRALKERPKDFRVYMRSTITGNILSFEDTRTNMMWRVYRKYSVELARSTHCEAGCANLSLGFWNSLAVHTTLQQWDEVHNAHAPAQAHEALRLWTANNEAASD